MGDITATWNTGEIGTQNGSPYANAYKVDSAGTAPAGAVFSLPHIAKSEFSGETSQNKVPDEKGIVFVSDGQTETSFTFDVMQQSKAVFDMPYDGGDHYYTIVKELNYEAINSKRQYLVIPYGKFRKSLKISKPGQGIQLVVDCFPLKGLATLDLTTLDTNFAASLTCQTFVCAQDTIFKIYEQ